MRTVYPISLKLSKRLRELRKKYNYTQVKLAELSNVEDKHIQLLESKSPCEIKIHTLEKIAKAFKMTPSELIDFD